MSAEKLRKELDEYASALETGDIKSALRSLASARKLLSSSDVHMANLAAAGAAIAMAEARLEATKEDR